MELMTFITEYNLQAHINCFRWRVIFCTAKHRDSRAADRAHTRCEIELNKYVRPLIHFVFTTMRRWMEIQCLECGHFSHFVVRRATIHRLEMDKQFIASLEFYHCYYYFLCHTTDHTTASQRKPQLRTSIHAIQCNGKFVNLFSQIQ